MNLPFLRRREPGSRRSAPAGGCRQVSIEPYRGYGTRSELLLMGRVFCPRPSEHRRPGHSLIGLLQIVLTRLMRRPVAEAVVQVRFDGVEQQVRTDPDGYFRCHLQTLRLPPSNRLWHPIDLDLVEPDVDARARGQVFVPPISARYVVISDIDDTVVYTGVANKLLMLWRLFVQDAQARIAFPGVAALYRALHQGASGGERNPLLYVSRGPWGLYDVLDEFFDRHAIPVGPILFLREWGVHWTRPWPRRAAGHKLDVIRRMLALYEDLPFVLIGDSGQHDPEIYAQIVRENPGRVLAIYIRNVTSQPARGRAIEALAEEVAASGSSLLLAADSFAMAEHAAEHGFISTDALAAVLAERVEERGEADLKPTRIVAGASDPDTREAVDRGELGEALTQGRAGDTPPNVRVETRSDDERK